MVPVKRGLENRSSTAVNHLIYRILKTIMSKSSPPPTMIYVTLVQYIIINKHAYYLNFLQTLCWRFYEHLFSRAKDKRTHLRTSWKGVYHYWIRTRSKGGKSGIATGFFSQLGEMIAYSCDCRRARGHVPPGKFTCLRLLLATMLMDTYNVMESQFNMYVLTIAGLLKLCSQLDIKFESRLYLAFAF